MNETLKGVIRILEEAHPELQIAAAQVLGEIRPKEPQVVTALEVALRAGPRVLGPFVIDALGKIGSEDAIALLVRQLDRDAGSHTDRIVLLLADAGAAAVPELTRAFREGEAELRHRVLDILGRIPGAKSRDVLLEALLDDDHGIAAKAASVCEERLASADEEQRTATLERLQKTLAARADELDEEALAGAVRLIGNIDGQKARPTLLKFAQPKFPPLVRQAALEALDGVDLTPAQARTLLGYLDEDDAFHVVEPAARALCSVDSWPADTHAGLLDMLRSRQRGLRLFALTAMRSVPKPEAVKRCMAHLDSDDEEFRDAAAEALGSNPKALEPLLRAFQLEKDEAKARLRMRPLVMLAKHFKPAQVKALTEKAARLVSAGDAAGDRVVELLLAVRQDKAAAAIVDKALRLRRARKFDEAATLLSLVGKHGGMPDEGWYQLAVTRLLIEGGRAERNRPGDPTMGYFARLLRAEFPLFNRLKKESMLDADMLLRVGGHFAEGVGNERRFSSDLLHHLAERHGRKKAGETAKELIRAEGL